MHLTADQLSDVMPHCPTEKLLEYSLALSPAMHEAGIDTVARAAYFLGQVAHESGELRYWMELTDGSRYERRNDLGNTEPGDGPRYRGRGPIQITGRANYRDAGLALGVELERNPDLALDPGVAFRIAAWFWRRRGCNDTADHLDVDGTTKKINGGLNGIEDRRRHTARAMGVLIRTAKLL